MSKPAWEKVAQDERSELTRIKVPGGWLYRTAMWDDDNLTLAMAFVPDAPPEYRSR